MSLHRTVVLNVVGLTPGMLGEHTPHLRALARAGSVRPLRTVLPAVTCSVQATFTTGLPPSEHGCVANGWYFRELAEVWLWRQSNRLVGGEKLWDAARARDASFTCAQLFWWYNMYAAVDLAVTPRPIYRADGLKLPDIHTSPSSLREELNAELGPFPLFQFWGPGADISSTRWIARCARLVYDRHRPTLTLVYLPHLDYDLQRLGPDHPDIPRALREVDDVCGELIRHVTADGARVLVLSEYGMTPVRGAVHLNRALREAGWLAVREELGEEKLDAGASQAFAVADHQVAHVYVQRPELIAEVKRLLERLEGVEEVLDEEGKRRHGLAHPRSGELVAISRPDRWFSYYYWLDDRRAPDFARTVDIHRKPGYDPVELFMDPSLRAPRLEVGLKLLKKKLGLRYLMDVVPLDASLVKGSHGRPTEAAAQGPLILSSEPRLLPEREVRATEVKALILTHLFEARPAVTSRERSAAEAG